MSAKSLSTLDLRCCNFIRSEFYFYLLFIYWAGMEQNASHRTGVLFQPWMSDDVDDDDCECLLNLALLTFTSLQRGSSLAENRRTDSDSALTEKWNSGLNSPQTCHKGLKRGKTLSELKYGIDHFGIVATDWRIILK
jgi:hypothetical protein